MLIKNASNHSNKGVFVEKVSRPPDGSGGGCHHPNKNLKMTKQVVREDMSVSTAAESEESGWELESKAIMLISSACKATSAMVSPRTPVKLIGGENSFSEITISTTTPTTSSSFSCAFESEEFAMELEEIPRLLMVELQKEKAEDVVHGLKDLEGLLRPENKNCKTNLQEALSCGAPSVMVLLMKKWKSHEVIQTVGCCCIFHLCSATASRIAVAKARGLDTIVETMKTFPTSQGIQFAGCGAIMKAIAAVGSKGADSLALRKAARRFVYEMDGVSLILRAMIQFRRFSGFQGICCEALDNLASEEEFVEAMMKSNVIKAVAATLELHKEDKTCHEHATRFMHKTTVQERGSFLARAR